MSEISKMVCIACSVFKPELTALHERGRIDFPIRYLDSCLHMSPVELYERMNALVENERSHNHRVLLIYGDCHPYMADLAASSDVVRVRGLNCGEILLGRGKYKPLLKENVFCLFPEWTLRWRDILTMLFDLNEEFTIEIMQDEHSKLVYLDTGVRPVPQEELKACSEYFGLPYEVFSVSLDHLLGVIQDAIRELKNSGGGS